MIKMLMFDFRNSEKDFFKTNHQSDFDITFKRENLNENTKLTAKEKNETVILSVFTTSKITEKVINQFNNLQIIATRSTGYNHIDIETCRKKNIAVINISDYGRTSVAQYTIGIILAMIRNVIQSSNDVKNRHIDYEKYEGHDISNLILGVIGTGSIGSAVCEIANTLGMKIYAHDLKINKNINTFVKYVSLNDVLKNSNIITLHIPYQKEFHHLLSTKEFNMMQESSYIINTARGELIDTKALYDAIKSGKIKGAALDVLECEELLISNEDLNTELKNTSYKCLENALISQKLMEFDNVIITPHIAYNTKESIDKILKTMFFAIKNYFKGMHTNRIV